jgi:uncharacterized protein YdcH (DUF465 family)
MFNETHELAHEFPEFKDAIHKLKMTDAHFAKLSDEYHKVTREVSRIEQELEAASDSVAEALKKKRLVLKDELFALLKKAA